MWQYLTDLLLLVTRLLIVISLPRRKLIECSFGRISWNPSMTHLQKIHSFLSTLTKQVWSEEEINFINLCLQINWRRSHLVHWMGARLVKTQSFHMISSTFLASKQNSFCIIFWCFLWLKNLAKMCQKAWCSAQKLQPKTFSIISSKFNFWWKRMFLLNRLRYANTFIYCANWLVKLTSGSLHSSQFCPKVSDKEKKFYDNDTRIRNAGSRFWTSDCS